jgi:hypothetical protein
MNTDQNGKDHSGDPDRYPRYPIAPTCWFCGAPHPRGFTVLGSNTESGGTKIDVCAQGEGCNDGRILHGPMGLPHYRGEDCGICGPGDRQQAAPRIAGVVKAARNGGRRRPAR